MRQIVTTGIVLGRTDYGEADRILILLTPDQGKIHLVAKGVRKIKSKLAGGIELFSVTQITYIPGRSGSGLGTLISSRLVTYYRHIVKDINRTMLGYDLIKQLHKVTEDSPEPEYFDLLQHGFEALDDATIDVDLIRVWFGAQLLLFGGHTPNLETDTNHQKLDATKRYDFSYDDTGFAQHNDGGFGADDIKFLRLLFSGAHPAALARVGNTSPIVARLLPLCKQLVQLHLGV